jgi:hypothetical protein
MTVTRAVCVLCGQPLNDHAQVIHDVSVDALESVMRSMDGFALHEFEPTLEFFSQRRRQRESRLTALGFEPVTDEDRARGNFGA